MSAGSPRGSWWCTAAPSSTSCSPATAPARQAAFFLRQRGRDLDEVEARHDGAAGGADRRVCGHPGRLAARARRPRRPRPVPVRARGHRGRGRPGRPGRQRRQVPRRPAGHRRQPRARRATPACSCRHAPGARRPRCCADAADGRAASSATMVAADARRRPGAARAQRGVRRPPDPPVGALPLPRPTAGRSGSRRPGVVVGTGTGATGWCARSRASGTGALAAARPDRRAALCWFVREAWPSPATGTTLTEGRLAAGATLALTCETDGLVVLRRRHRERPPGTGVGPAGADLRGGPVPALGGRRLSS